MPMPMPVPKPNVMCVKPLLNTSFSNKPELLNFNENCVPKHVRGEFGRNNSWRT